MMAQQNGGDKITRNIVIGMVLLVVLAGVGASLFSSHSTNSSAKPAAASKADGYGITFNPNAKVRVDFWEDFQCPNCRNFEAVNSSYVNSLVTAGKIKAVFHPMSFIGPESILAGSAAGCASDAGKFLEFHTALYANQPKTENSGLWNAQVLTILGIGSGIKDKNFSQCVKSSKYEGWLSTIETDATKQGVNSTPTVFVNGQLMPTTNYLDVKKFSAYLAAAGVK
jgi:protein-disulfide isomerase